MQRVPVNITSIHTIYIAHYGTHATGAWAIASSRSGWKVARLFDGLWFIQVEPMTEVLAERYIVDSCKADGLIAIPAKGTLFNTLAYHALTRSTNESGGSVWYKFKD